MAARTAGSRPVDSQHAPAAAASHLVAGKGRPPLTQMMAVGVLMSMAFLIVYMYQVIDGLHREQQGLHREQQEMRTQISQLAGTNQYPSGSSHRLVTPQVRPEFLEARQFGPEVGLRTLEGADTFAEAERRKLAAIFSTGQSAGVGCFELADAAANTIDVSSLTGCNSNVCPDCFVTPATLSQGTTLTIQACSGAQWVRSTTRTGIWVYTFINTHATYTVTVVDNGGGVTYKIPAGSFVTAYCASALGTTNRLYFPSTDLPTLTVDSGFTLSAGAFDASSSTGAFTTSSGTVTLSGNTAISGASTFVTGTGAISLNGDTTVGPSAAKTFTVGATGAAGATSLFGALTVGHSSNNAATTVYGTFLQTGAYTFGTGTGTISLNGHTTVATAKNLHMTATGAGTFQTGTGSVTLYGDTTISGSGTFTTGSGVVQLNGDTTVGLPSTSRTFTVGVSGTAGATTLYGSLTVGDSSNNAATTLVGSFAQSGLHTFATGTGLISLNGDTTVASAKYLHMAAGGTGSFQTGTGSVTLNGNTQISSSNTFTTGTGAVELSGTTLVTAGKTFTVGSPTTAAAGTNNVQLFGDVFIGGSTTGQATSLTIYGNVAFTHDGTSKTFTSSHTTHTFNGDIGIGAGYDLIMANTGAGLFQTGTGTVQINGATTIASGKTFTALDAGASAMKCTSGPTETGLYCRSSR
ncbi:unnamed protein product [Polarella glacialis]|uniref:Uncharacterized protein n=1 Tax=Polarella glacialis TaxID=89957 RepID=A0A813J2T8_POLGL|nr:unnamed protein product [Polarella glacialis]CAE8666035.1 unnamed protein product [Polarella glacialis]